MIESMKYFFSSISLFLFPFVASAQLNRNDGIQDFLIALLNFLNEVVVPFIFALAFLFFIWNAARYFIIESGNEEGREKAKRLALWGIIAFVLMISIWGIVNLLVGGLGFSRSGFVCPDYLPAGACDRGVGNDPTIFP